MVCEDYQRMVHSSPTKTRFQTAALEIERNFATKTAAKGKQTTTSNSNAITMAS